MIFCNFKDDDVECYAEYLPEVFPPTKDDLAAAKQEKKKTKDEKTEEPPAALKQERKKTEEAPAAAEPENKTKPEEKAKPEKKTKTEEDSSSGEYEVIPDSGDKLPTDTVPTQDQRIAGKPGVKANSLSDQFQIPGLELVREETPTKTLEFGEEQSVKALTGPGEVVVSPAHSNVINGTMSDIENIHPHAAPQEPHCHEAYPSLFKYQMAETHPNNSAHRLQAIDNHIKEHHDSSASTTPTPEHYADTLITPPSSQQNHAQSIAEHGVKQEMTREEILEAALEFEQQLMAPLQFALKKRH